MRTCLGARIAPPILIVVVDKRSGKTLGLAPQIIIASVCKMIEMPIAVISGANLGAFLKGLYATRSIKAANIGQKKAAELMETTKTREPGNPGKSKFRIEAQVSPSIAPIISTSPCAKFIN